MNKAYFGLILVLGLVAFGAGCAKKSAENVNEDVVVNQGYDLNDALDLNVSEFDNTNTAVVNDNTNTDEEIDNTNTTVTNDNENTNTTTTNSSTNKNTNASTAAATGTISITAPAPDTELVSPFYVEGTATTGSLVYVRLKAGGVTIFTEKVSVRNGAFKGKLLFDFSRTTSGTIEVFQKNSDDEEVNMQSVDVKFKLSTTNSNANTNTTNSNLNVNS